MNQEVVSDNDRELWQRFIEAHHSYISLRTTLLLKSSSTVELIRSGLHNPTERAAALSTQSI